MEFRVGYTSVDGYGSYPDTFGTLDDAIVFADQKQRQTDAHGNEYAYTYTVRRCIGTRSDVMHRTRSSVIGVRGVA